MIGVISSLVMPRKFDREKRGTIEEKRKRAGADG